MTTSHAPILVLTFLVAGLAALAIMPTGYLFVLAMLGGVHRPQTPRGRTLRFAFLVPAHNESAGIAATVASLHAVSWPRERVDVYVVADNCSDDTADVARAAGAIVLLRTDASKRGKGYALERGFHEILSGTAADAVVVVDADSVVSPHLLEAFAARIDAGALAMQAEYGVRNPEASWRTELMTLALAMFHTLRNNARERLGLSVGLRGNGMCFTRACLERFPPKAYGLVEDVEHGIALGRAGVRVVAVSEASVLGEMVSGGTASESQRRRWEDGRVQLKREVLPGLLREAIVTRRALLLDLAMDLMVPPLSTVALLVGVVAALGAARLWLCWPLGLGVDVVSVGAVLPVLFMGAYLARGLQLSGLGLRGVVVLAKAPAYVVWKIALKLRKRSTTTAWVRTERETKTDAGSR
jgi:1,2-diacylglycerol 3-beta-glucosyltransferase